MSRDPERVHGISDTVTGTPRLAGKVALISGAARGMGAAEARLFAREGAQVVIADVLDTEGKAVEAEVTAAGGAAVFVHLDVTREVEWAQAIAVAESRFGKLNVLVNNAGIGAASRIEDTDAEAWDRVMEVNAKGVFLGTRAAIPAMRRAGGGSIVNISSQLGLVGMDDSSPQYTASKGAVRLLTKTTALQYAREGTADLVFRRLTAGPTRSQASTRSGRGRRSRSRPARCRSARAARAVVRCAARRAPPGDAPARRRPTPPRGRRRPGRPRRSDPRRPAAGRPSRG